MALVPPVEDDRAGTRAVLARSRLMIRILRSPTFMRRANGWLALFWLCMLPISIWTGWISSVAYVSALSLWALVASHWSGWQSARVEVKQASDRVEVRQEADADVQVVLDEIRS